MSLQFYITFFLFATMKVITAARMRINVLIGAKEQPALYPSRHGLLTYGKGVTVLIAARTNPMIMM